MGTGESGEGGGGRGEERRHRCWISGDNILLILTVLSVVLGVVVGVGIKLGRGEEHPLSPRQIASIKFPGEIFLRMLKLLILPLITSSLISSLTSLDTKTAGRMGLYAFGYYMATTLLAVITGIILVLSIQPGNYGAKLEGAKNPSKCIGTVPSDTIMDLVRNMFPNNIVEATFRSVGSCVTYKNKNTSKVMANQAYHKWLDSINQSASNNSQDENWWQVPYTENKDGMNILGLVVFSVIFGIVINVMGPEGLPLVHFFKALEGAMMRMVTLVIWFSPVGIFFLISAQILKMDDLVKELQRLGMYMLTVILGLFIHGFLTLPVLFLLLARRNPFKFVYGMLQALLTALGTASSSATMPLTLRCLEVNNKIDQRVTRFMIPLGATINMDGTALYEAVAALYIAQSLGRVLSFGQVVLISLTATLASIGAAGIPSAGLVTMVMVLIAVGLPAEYYTLIVPVDWFLDRIRTTINVHGDSLGTGIVQRLCKSQLDEDKHNERNEEQFNRMDSTRRSHNIPKDDTFHSRQMNTENSELASPTTINGTYSTTVNDDGFENTKV